MVWMYGGDIRMQLNDRFAIAAEGFYGNALGSYAAGVKQIFNRDTGEGIRACGGFVEVEYKISKQRAYHVGFLHDNPNDNDVALSGRTYQQNLYSNLMYFHSRYLQIGFEAAYLKAGFKDPTTLDNQAWVAHNKIIFSF